MLVTLLQCDRDVNQNPDESKAELDAKQLYDAGEGKWGTDESEFNLIFLKRSPQEISAIARHYKNFSGKTFKEVIDSEFSGDSKKLLLAVLECLINPEMYFAERVNKAIKGWGTNDHLLIRVLVSREEIDIQGIKACYEKEFGNTMLKDVEGDTSGDYKKLLIALINK